MIKVKDRNMYLNESIIKDTFKRGEQYCIKDDVGNVWEVDEYDYYTIEKRLKNDTRRD